jgi:sugar O-acyltransferase (sialic acid O-acetyltransferase NeuD family)
LKKPLIIFGAGGLGREIKTLVDVLPEWETIGFCDDEIPAGQVIMGLPVLGNQQYLLRQGDDLNVIVAMGNPQLKFKVVEHLSVSSFIKFPSLVHPRAILSDLDTIRIGDGSIISAGCILTTSITIGKHVLLNLNTTVGHDAVVGDYTSVMPGVNLAGNVKIGECVLIGSGANILNKIMIGDRAIIGSGAVVTKSIDAGITAVGVPARGK